MDPVMTRALPFALSLALGLALSPAGAANSGTPTDKGGGVLDGLVFVTTMRVDEYDAPFDDRITFDNGAFHSEECQRACDFGWTAYYTRQEGDSVAFIVETACSDAPQSVRFTGRVTGSRIEGSAVWTTERFYWTVQRNATFSGTLASEPAGTASLQTE
jgi:hypothetical protein